MTCSRPLAWELLVDYWADDLGPAEVDDIDEHLFGCGACTAQSQAIATMVMALRDGVPPVVSAAQVRRFAARGLVLEHNVFRPDHPQAVRFKAGVDLLIHHLTGLDLVDAACVSVEVRSESSGALMAEDHLVPFDRERGEVLIACQRHFAGMPPDVQFDVIVQRADGGSTRARFNIPHVFDTAPVSR